MKKALFLFVYFATAMGLILAVVLTGKHLFHGANSQKTVATQPKPSPVHPSPPPLMARDEFQKYRNAREKALQSDPALQAEYKDILAKMEGQQEKLDAAMMKADPKLAPVVAKLVALRASPGVPIVDLTQADWQELRTARAEAMKPNSGLQLESKKQTDRMASFEDKLDAAMIKSDPTVAPLIIKFEAGRHRQVIPGNSSAAR